WLLLHGRAWADRFATLMASLVSSGAAVGASASTRAAAKMRNAPSSISRPDPCRMRASAQRYCSVAWNALNDFVRSAPLLIIGSLRPINRRYRALVWPRAALPIL